MYINPVSVLEFIKVASGGVCSVFITQKWDRRFISFRGEIIGIVILVKVNCYFVVGLI